MKQEQKKLYKYMVFNNIWGQLNIMEYILKPPKFKQNGPQYTKTCCIQ